MAKQKQKKSLKKAKKVAKKVVKKVVLKKVVAAKKTAVAKKAAPAPKLAPKKQLVIQTHQVVQHQPMTQAELEELEQSLQDQGYRLSIMTNISDAERKAAFEAALAKAIKSQKPYETTWEGNIVTLWVKKEK